MTTTTTQKRIAVTMLQGQKVSCGECSGFAYDKLIGGKQKNGCAVEYNKTADCEACSKFAPDARQMDGFVGTTGFEALTNLVASIDGSSLKVLSALLRTEPLTRKNGFAFGQKVYVRYRGRANADYMSNYMSAYVVFVNKNYMRLMGKDARCVLTYTRDCMPTMYTPEDFAPLRATMESKGRRVDPDVQTTTAKRLRHMEEMELDMVQDSKAGNITNIDTVFRENAGKRAKSEVYDLVNIVGDLMKGYAVKGKGKAMKHKVPVKPKSGTIVRKTISKSRTDMVM